MTQRRLLALLLVPAALLALPAAAMTLQVEGWAWTTADFVFAWIALSGTLGGWLFLANRAPNRTYRTAAALALATGLALLWVNGAVGLIGREDNPANRLYAGVLALGLLGAALARARPRGLARALAVTAFAQFLVPLIALLRWPDDFSPGLAPVLGLNFAFVLLFATAAWLFRRAGRPAVAAEAPSRV